jgi:Copper binding proteins, plastocyanin/azurin family
VLARNSDTSPGCGPVAEIAALIDAFGSQRDGGFALKHGPVTFKVTNKGAVSHDFKLCGTGGTGGTANTCHGRSTPLLATGKSATLTVPIPKAGTYEYLCSVAGHAAAGMKSDLKAT